MIIIILKIYKKIIKNCQLKIQEMIVLLHKDLKVLIRIKIKKNIIKRLRQLIYFKNQIKLLLKDKLQLKKKKKNNNKILNTLQKNKNKILQKLMKN